MPEAGALSAPRGRLRLGVNIDHVATIRNARGGGLPDPIRAAKLAEDAGADGITAHLREDRRHITDADIERLMQALSVPLNFEMAATDEMQAIALRHRPHAVCIVPERREDLWKCCDELTRIVLDAGGKFYFAKDLVLGYQAMMSMFPTDKREAFLAMKEELDPEGLLQTNLWRRVFTECDRYTAPA